MALHVPFPLHMDAWLRMPCLLPAGVHLPAAHHWRRTRRYSWSCRQRQGVHALLVSLKQWPLLSAAHQRIMGAAASAPQWRRCSPSCAQAPLPALRAL